MVFGTSSCHVMIYYMADSDTEIEELRHRLNEVHEELDKVLGYYYSWQLHVGRWTLVRPLTSQLLFKLFLAFHLALSLIGGVLIVTGSGRLPELGIALVVGGLFSAGSFMTVLWEQVVEKDHVLGEHASRRARVRYWELIGECEAISAKLVHLGAPDPHSA